MRSATTALGQSNPRSGICCTPAYFTDPWRRRPLACLLTAALSWRWVLLVNVPIGAGLLAATFVVLRPAAVSRAGARLDFPSAVTVTLAVVGEPGHSCYLAVSRGPPRLPARAAACRDRGSAMSTWPGHALFASRRQKSTARSGECMPRPTSDSGHTGQPISARGRFTATGPTPAPTSEPRAQQHDNDPTIRNPCISGL